jgi:hypothetical protein
MFNLKQTRCNRITAWAAILAGLMTWAAAPLAFAQSFLESPTAGSFESGVSLIRGWVCQAGGVEVVIDQGTPAERRLATAYPTRRQDTESVCGDTDNGFGVTINWNNLDDGVHTLRAVADGVEFASVNFIVTTLGGDFRTDVSGQFSLADFPAAGNTTTVRWSEPHQNFVITRNLDVPPNPAPPSVPRTFLESPTQGSSESGIGLIRGWVCEANAVEVVIDAGTAGERRLATAYPTRRQDTEGACGDSDNGFGITINWNNLGDGVHTLSALADGVEFANVNFAVTTLGGDFLRGLRADYPLSDFPAAGQRTNLRWSEPHQNFIISTSTATGDKVALIAALLDQANPFGAIAANPANFADLFGVRVERAGDGRTVGLAALEWADLEAGLWARLVLGSNGLPEQYQDSQGVVARFANFTNTSVDITFFDSNGAPIAGPFALPIDLNTLLPLQGLGSRLNTAPSSAGGSILMQQSVTLAAATLDTLTVEMVWSGGIALNEMLCQIGTLDNAGETASAGCGAPVVSGFEGLAAAPGGALDPTVQQALKFSRAVLDNAPCNAAENTAACLLEAADALREIEPEEGGSAPTVPGVPTNVRASDGLYPDKVTILWNAVTDAAYYEVYRNGDRIAQPSRTELDDFNVTPGTRYGYRVKACNGVGCGEFSTADEGYAEPQAQQFTVTAIAGAGGRIEPPSQTVEAGAVARFTVTADPEFVIGAVTGCAGALSGNVYTTGAITADCTVNAVFIPAGAFRIILAAAGTGGGTMGGDGVYPAGATVTLTAQPFDTSDFAGWSPAPCADSFIMPAQDLTCTATFNLKSYTVDAVAGTGGSITPPSQTVDHGNTASFTVTPDIDYQIETVSGCDGSLDANNNYTTGPITAACTVNASFTPTATIPGIPDRVSASDGGFTDRVDIAWLAVPSATSYQVYRDGGLIGEPTAASQSDTAVNPGQIYDYSVRACNPAGCSSESQPNPGHARLSAPANAATSCDFSGPSTDGIPVFSWSAVSGAVEFYEVYFSGSPGDVGSWWGNISPGVTTVDNLRSGQWYRARACNGSAGCGDFSAPAEAPFCIG